MTEPVRAWCAKSPDGEPNIRTIAHDEWASALLLESNHRAIGVYKTWFELGAAGWRVVPVDIVEVKDAG